MRGNIAALAAQVIIVMHAIVGPPPIFYDGIKIFDLRHTLAPSVNCDTTLVGKISRNEKPSQSDRRTVDGVADLRLIRIDGPMRWE
jgi:hypothetical protein